MERKAFLLFAPPSFSPSLFSFFIHLDFLWLKAMPHTPLLCCPPRCDGFGESCLSLTPGVGSTKMVCFMVCRVSQCLETRAVLQRMSTQYPAGIFCAFSSPLVGGEGNTTLHLIWCFGGNNSQCLLNILFEPGSLLALPCFISLPIQRGYS